MKSIHLTEIKPLTFDFSKEIKNGDSIIEIVSQARGEKTNHNVSLKTPIKNMELSVTSELKEAIVEAQKDFKATLFIKELKMNETSKEHNIDKIELELAEQDN